ncbi:unnamed protein product [Chrysoparadoxa australica]
MKAVCIMTLVFSLSGGAFAFVRSRPLPVAQMARAMRMQASPIAEEDRKWAAPHVRQTFIDYFSSKQGHTYFPSSPVVPVNDPTLLFANAGMNQFKPIFLGQVDPKSPLAALSRAVNSQKCIRAGGKHNDLEDVGKDTYHHTFFEMMGTWSFNDYFKQEAIAWSWELLTEVYGLQTDRLYATYFQGDESLGLGADTEARDFWLQVLPPERVLPGSRADNFWEMGDTGPCGPCSELHYDRVGGRDAAALVNADSPDVVEIWNLVFMQFNKQAGLGELQRLPAQHVDTGLGLERLVSILQGKPSNYDTDLFTPLFAAIHSLLPEGSLPYSGKVGADDIDLHDTAYRVLADHARTLTFAIADGAVPSNEGRGYVLRRILRRAVRYGQQILGASDGFFQKLIPVVVAELGDAFPELRSKESVVLELVAEEEQAFCRLLERGVKYFKEVEEELMRKGSKTVSGQSAFFMYDTLGFPIDLTQLMAAEVGLEVDMKGFETEMETQKSRSKDAEILRKAQGLGGEVLSLGAAETAWLADNEVPSTDDSAKYSTDVIEATVLAVYQGGSSVTLDAPESFSEASSDGSVVGVVLDSTSFYAEAGGQVGDVGLLSLPCGGELEVLDVQNYAGYVLHTGRVVGGGGKVGDRVTCKVDAPSRTLVAPNHTMTHVLNHALREVLKVDVDQKGSLVNGEKLRFDFSFNKALSAKQLEQVEGIVQQVIEQDKEVFNQVVPLDQAKAINGLRAVFGEVYPDPVRVVSVGSPISEMVKDPENNAWQASSVEFCGGTHLKRTGAAKAFAIVEETAVAKGIRRVTAITGDAAMDAIDAGQRLQAAFDSTDGMPDAALEGEVTRLRKELNTATMSAALKGKLRASAEQLQKKLVANAKSAAAARATEGVNEAQQAAKDAAARGDSALVMEVRIGADSKAVKRVLDAVAKAAPGLSFMGFSAEYEDAVEEGQPRKVLCFNQVSAADLESGVDAKQWLTAALEPLGGRGGGRPYSAQGQAPSSEKLPAALAASEAYVKEQLSVAP